MSEERGPPERYVYATVRLSPKSSRLAKDTPPMTKTLVERLREPSISEGLMKTWDWIRRMIAEGDKSSYPRDIFESVIDGFDEERREAADRIEKLEAALRRIAEGNVGEMPWQAHYSDLQDVARAAVNGE